MARRRATKELKIEVIEVGELPPEEVEELEGDLARLLVDSYFRRRDAENRNEEQPDKPAQGGGTP